eukprot:Phypoly_transcript_14816.p1 GENE.Phypoly_transcript_14816~~Phypoly_transcript_14816.p1  ORF type:complete len:284 (+),score=68.05 Phypoly_transcript_14816:85-936(+)
MAKRSKGEVVSIRGPAHLAYIALDESEDNHAFQGHVIDSTTKQCFGFMATQIERKNPLDCCCQADDPPLWFKMTIIDYQDKKETQRVIEKTGGDYLILSSPNISFVTENLKTGQQAEEHMRKYNPKLLGYADALVCVGDMTIRDLDFDESCDENNLICSHHHDEVPHKTPEKREKREKEEDREIQETDGSEKKLGTTESMNNVQVAEKPKEEKAPGDGDNNKDEGGWKTKGRTKREDKTREEKTREEKGNAEADDDDFGFEEFKDVRLIKVGLNDAEKSGSEV